MAWFIGFAVIGIAIAFLLTSDSYKSERMFGIVMAVLVSAIPATVANAISSSFVDTEWHVAGRDNIKSINDTSNINGNFFLGTGSVNEQQVFWYYTDNGDYAELKSKPARASRIVEGSYDQPHVVREVEHSTNNWLMIMPKSPTRWTFYIPDDSITNSFELDARP